MKEELDYALLTKQAVNECIAVLGIDSEQRPLIESRQEERWELVSPEFAPIRPKGGGRMWPGVKSAFIQRPDAQSTLYFDWKRFQDLPGVNALRARLLSEMAAIIPRQVASVGPGRTEIRPGMLLVDDWLTINTVAGGVDCVWSGNSLDEYCAGLDSSLVKAVSGPRQFRCQAPLEGFQSVADSPIQFPHGIILRRLSDSEWSDIFSPSVASFRGDFQELIRTTWTMESVIDSNPERTGPNKDLMRLFNALLSALRLFKAGSLDFRQVRCQAQFGPRTGWAASWPPGRGVPGFGKEYHLEASEVPLFQSFWTTHAPFLLGDEARAFHNSLVRFNDAACRHHQSDRFLDLVFGLEALLRGNSSARFAQRGAFLIGKTPADRRVVFDALREAYNLRNGAVHAGSKEASEAKADQLESLFRLALRRFMDLRPKVETWDSLLERIDYFGIDREADETLEQYLRRTNVDDATNV